MINLSFLYYKVTIYSSSYFLEKLKSLNIKVVLIYKIDNYDYQIKIPYRYKRIFEENFKNVELLKISGLKAFFNNINLYKYTLISFIISLCFFFYLSSRISLIEIKGNNISINNELKIYLKENNLSRLNKLPTLEELDYYENMFFYDHLSSLKSLDFYIIGTKLIVTYDLKDKEIIIEDNKGKMYASKEGIISKISISSGNVLVKENDYVKKGTLLVDDHIYYKDEPIYVGTKGSIYAYTFSTLEINATYMDNEVDTFTYCINKARSSIYNSFISEEDHIDKETILEYYCSKQENKAYLKVFYTLYQDIVTY